MKFIYKQNENKSLIVEDRIFGKIIIQYPFSKIVLTKEMQRLAEISQNGFSQIEFKELEKNDRLHHSIGAFHIMSLFLQKLENILNNFGIKLSQEDKDIALCSMLLHDIGHGPFSHSLEIITDYSHEKRTTDILLGNTEVNKVITEIFGPKKVKKIASFIAKINDEEDLGKDSFTKLLNNLVSYQLDADRIDYLVRDASYVDVHSAIDLKKIIASVNVIINNNQEYELLINRNGLASIENVLLQRFQMYRDVYLSPISVLGDWIFKQIITRYRECSNLHELPISPSFKILAYDHQVSDLNSFLQMKDLDFKESFRYLANYAPDSIIAYLCQFAIEDYFQVKNNVSIEKIKRKLNEIFKGADMTNTLSIVSMEAKTKLYKKEQKLKIQNGNRIMDLTECTNLIRPQESLEDRYVFFNPEILRLELGLSIEEYQKYESEIKKMLEELNKKPEEFELKYIIEQNDEKNVFEGQESLLSQLIEAFKVNGFKVISVVEKQNNDEYYDNKNFDLYNQGGSLRIRKVNKDGKEKIKATYKMPLEKGEVYSSRSEMEENLNDDSFQTLQQKMIDLQAGIDFEQMIDKPLLNSYTKRTDVVLDKMGVQVCLSFDNSQYTNHMLDEISVLDKMIEIEAIGELNNRIILNEIHDFITSQFPSLQINKQSKYERGINSTTKKYKKIQEALEKDVENTGESSPSAIRLLKSIPKIQLNDNK